MGLLYRAVALLGYRSSFVTFLDEACRSICHRLQTDHKRVLQSVLPHLQM